MRYTDPSGHWTLLIFEASSGPVDEQIRLLERKHGVDLQPYRSNLNTRRLASLDQYFDENPRAFLDYLAPEIDPFLPKGVNDSARDSLKQARATLYGGDKAQKIQDAAMAGQNNPIGQDDIFNLTTQGTISPETHVALVHRMVANANSVPVRYFLLGASTNISLDLGAHPTNFEPNYLAELMLYNRPAIAGAREQYALWVQLPQNRALLTMGLTGGGD